MVIEVIAQVTWTGFLLGAGLIGSWALAFAIGAVIAVLFLG